MGKRRESRTHVSIPVHVSGIDHYGNPFRQTARTIDVSMTGARLSGIRCLRGTGEIVTIDCSGRTAKFRVVWIGIPGTSEDGHFGVKALQPEKRIFKVEFAPPKPDSYAPPPLRTAKETTAMAPAIAEPAMPEKPRPSDESERRDTYRIRCSGTAQMTQMGVAYPIWAKLTDLSMGGCYLELVFTIPKGSLVDLMLTVQGRTFAVKGTIATTHPGVGVGIKFTNIGDANRKVLVELLQELTARKGPGAGSWTDAV